MQEKIEWNFKSNFTDSGLPMEIDIYFPNLNIGFEYRGEQHYEPINFLEEKNLKNKSKEIRKET